MCSKVNIQEKLHAEVRHLFKAGVEAVKPGALLRKTLRSEPKNGAIFVDGRSYLLNKSAREENVY